MTAKILDGKKLAESLFTAIKQQIGQRIEKGLSTPGLAVVLVGNDSASQLYVEKKREACRQVGINSYAHTMPDNTSQNELLNLISDLNNDPKIHGILVQLPLPSSIDSNTILEHISPHKDVDGFHAYNMGRLAQFRPLLRPCTPYGIMQLLENADIKLAGLHAVIVGASNIVGKPMALELLKAGCTVTICHSKTVDLVQHVKQADLLVAALGNPDVIKTEWLKESAIIIDVGMNRLADGKVVGDIDFASAVQRVSWITPVPGGVGPMTVASLMQNTLLAAEFLDTIATFN